MQFPTFAILALVVALVQAAPQGYTGTSDHEAIKCMKMDKQFDSHMRSTEAELPAGIDKCHEFMKYANTKYCDDSDSGCLEAAWAAWISGGGQS
ncbi:uncharacterized protein LAJ45_04972 [Morchella importuna]|uniref:Extracellular membrane protein CFEM domain-containing protein n=1 Tax=Morchella conica CCBAS932 TaxID=1392247 RepID=A0A3N4KUE8_9PEZI|nr:uncharacterized protein LAJ45_04972 [Morchella importuna]KAH8150791.1 hypothetical protein LAJ45_04972 [Morchella importuna]RPB14203.1 hypothetical protein P167DRAFT_604404 [Morchella conica CCBAS932]